MLTDRETDQLIDALGNCQAIKDESQLALIIDSLPWNIHMDLAPANTLRARLLRLVAACAAHPGGLAWLRTRLRRLEGDGTRHMATVDEVFRDIHHRVQPCLLIHHRAERASAEQLARWLHTKNVTVWLDSWNLSPTDSWPRPLTDALDECPTCVVLMNTGGAGPWQNEAMRVAIANRATAGSLRVVPVRLPGTRRDELDLLPPFLIDGDWAEFERALDEPAGRAHLLNRIRPERPSGGASSAASSPYLVPTNSMSNLATGQPRRDRRERKTWPSPTWMVLVGGILGTALLVSALIWIAMSETSKSSSTHPVAEVTVDASTTTVELKPNNHAAFVAVDAKLRELIATGNALLESDDEHIVSETMVWMNRCHAYLEAAAERTGSPRWRYSDGFKNGVWPRDPITTSFVNAQSPEVARSTIKKAMGYLDSVRFAVAGKAQAADDEGQLH